MNPQTWTDHQAAADAAVKMQAVLDSATQVSIIATDLDGLITVFNSGAERMLGHRAKDLIGRQTPEIIHRESEVEARGQELTQQHGRSIQGFDVFVNQAWQGNHEEREWTYVRKDGTFLSVNLVVTAVTDSARQANRVSGRCPRHHRGETRRGRNPAFESIPGAESA